MARGNQKPKGSKFKYFDCKLQVPNPRKVKDITTSPPKFTLRTRVEVDWSKTEEIVDPKDETKKIKVPVMVRDESGQPNILSSRQAIAEDEAAQREGRKANYMWRIIGSETQLSGYLVDLKAEYVEKLERHVFSIKLKDSASEEIYEIDMRFNNASISFVRRFLNLNPSIHNWLEVGCGIWENKGKNYSTMYLARSGGPSEKATHVKDTRFTRNADGSYTDVNNDSIVVPAGVEVKVGKKSEINYDDRNDKYVELLKAFGTELATVNVNDNGSKSANTNEGDGTPPAENAPVNTGGEGSQEPQEELPF